MLQNFRNVDNQRHREWLREQSLASDSPSAGLAKAVRLPPGEKSRSITLTGSPVVPSGNSSPNDGNVADTRGRSSRRRYVGFVKDYKARRLDQADGEPEKRDSPKD